MPPLKAQLLLAESLAAYFPEMVFTDSGITVQIHRNTQQVWSWLRQHVLANRSFKDYDDILDACTSAWKHFIADVERVMSLCSRDWIKLT